MTWSKTRYGYCNKVEFHKERMPQCYVLATPIPETPCLVPMPPDSPTTTTHVPSMANHDTLIPIALAYFVILNVTLILLLVRIINWFLCLPPRFIVTLDP